MILILTLIPSWTQNSNSDTKRWTECSRTLILFSQMQKYLLLGKRNMHQIFSRVIVLLRGREYRLWNADIPSHHILIPYCNGNLPPAQQIKNHINVLFTPGKRCLKKRRVHTCCVSVGCQYVWQVLRHFSLNSNILLPPDAIDAYHQVWCKHLKNLSVLREPHSSIGR